MRCQRGTANRVALATMMALGITDESDIAAGMLMCMDNVLAAYKLRQEFPGMTLAEVSAATTEGLVQAFELQRNNL